MGFGVQGRKRLRALGHRHRTGVRRNFFECKNARPFLRLGFKACGDIVNVDVSSLGHSALSKVQLLDSRDGMHPVLKLSANQGWRFCSQLLRKVQTRPFTSAFCASFAGEGSHNKA